jgi:CheY-like chemotaxis protein
MKGKEPHMVMSAKVLVIDDDPDFRDSVKSLLESRGCTVIMADSGKEGLRKLVEDKPDAILLDVMMETDVEGYSVTQAIKWQDEYAEYQNIPILMLSSIQETPDELFPRAGEVEMIRPDFYLSKPLDIPKFLATLERAVALYQAHRVGTV